MSENLSVIGQIAITVSDVEKALTFYRDVLGLEFLFSAGPELAFLNADGVRLMLSTPQGAGTVGSNSILYFKVSDIEAVHAAVVVGVVVVFHYEIIQLLNRWVVGRKNRLHEAVRDRPKNNDPELLMEAATWWIQIHKLDHFEKATKIRAMVESGL